MRNRFYKCCKSQTDKSQIELLIDFNVLIGFLKRGVLIKPSVN